MLDIGRVDLQVDGVDIREALEEDGLAFHHRLCGERAEISEAEDRRAVGDDGDQVSLGRIVVTEVRIFGDRQHGNGHARRIGQRKVPLGRHRLGRRDLELARLGKGVERKCLFLGKGGLLIWTCLTA